VVKDDLGAAAEPLVCKLEELSPPSRFRPGHAGKPILRLSTLIRHAPLSLTLSIEALTIAMVQPTLGTLLMPSIGLTPLLTSGFLAAAWAAVALTPVTARTNPKQNPTAGGQAKALTENR
jgi:hypothetical protein